MNSTALWNEQLSVGVKEIDEEHREILFLIRRLKLAMAQDNPSTEIDLILNSLADHALTHFSTEESHFLESGYPKADFHAQEHRRFERKINQFKKALTAGHVQIADEMFNHLSSWLTQHIEGADQEFAAFLTDRQKL
jgi:hemerythrin-like metal-binding protein